jgi:hypothetical protein
MMMVGDRLELLGREEAECGVPAAAVEEDLDVLEDLRAQRRLRGPGYDRDEQPPAFSRGRRPWC